MRFTIAATIAAVAAVANAHFHLEYPSPRGAFNEDNEVNFCDSYTNAGNRSDFPLSGGFISINSEHPTWTFGVLVSTSANPTSFDNFRDSSGNEQYAIQLNQVTGEGAFCFPIDLSKTNISGIANGGNVTVQIVFNGGDDTLYQCADLRLESNFTVPSDVSCSNATGSSSASGSSTGSATSATPSSTGSSGASAVTVGGLTGVLGAISALVMLIL